MYLFPKLSPQPDQAEQAISTLLRLALLTRDARGALQQVVPTVSTESETRWVHLADFHRDMIGHAASAIDRLPRSQRDITALTLCVDEGGFARVCEAIARLRRELLQDTEQTSQPRQVIQVNFQVYPLTCPVNATNGRGAIEAQPATVKP